MLVMHKGMTITHLCLMKRTVLSITIAFFLVQGVFSQSNMDGDRSHWALFWQGAVELNKEREFDERELTAIGFGVEYAFEISERFDLAMDLSYMRWNDRRETFVPLRLGFRYILTPDSATEFSIQGKAGPYGVIGNDYSGFFAGYEVGPMVSFPVMTKSRILVKLSFEQSTAFHPSHFEYIKLSLGWQF